jgi:hypothetical protein
MNFPPQGVGCDYGRATPSLHHTQHPAPFNDINPQQNATYHSRETVQTTGASSGSTDRCMSREPEVGCDVFSGISRPLLV